ncbi:uncharacterized protein C1orf167 homolog isoform X4 [Podarcis raffonei]|uniref:uncharacterized protein C1orf167 homolog isoform X4 n=1 Tax=Podarcis raffonei TaxID=65483 RepID=UPI00232934A4|nr:uncharacterized protein C1orf167 homolog isoform X4 [Podarcis raffonei]
MPRGRKKENIPPFLSGYVVSEERNVQRNININLYLSTERNVAADSVVRRSDCGGASSQGGKRAAFTGKGSNDLQQRRVVQTNLSCPYWPFQDATGGSSPKRQSNLASKLQRGASGDSEFTSDAPIPCPSLCSCSEQLGLKGNPPSHLSSRSHYVSHDCGTLSKNRMGSEDQYGSKPSHVCASRRICGHLGDCRGCFSPAELPVTSAPGSGSCQCPPTSPSKSDDSFHRGPGLTLHHLNSSTLVESTGSSAALQTLLKSSRTSADLHRSIRQLKREAASSMGALSSSPWESKRPLFPCQPLRNPQVSTSTVLSAVEHLAAGESYARQASVKWRAPFPRDWGGTSTEGKPISVVYRCDNAGLQTCPTEALDQSGFRGGFDLTSLALRGEDLCSKTSIRYLECCSGGGWRTRERTGACGCSKTCCHQKAADPEELASGALCRSELSLSDHALSLLSFDSLEVSLKTLCADSPANLGSPVCVSLSVHSPACRFRNGNQDSDLCEAGGELGEDSGGPTLSAREHAADLPHWKLGRFGEHWQAANSIGATVVGSSGNGSPNSMPGDCWPDAENSQGGGPSAEQTGKRTTALYDEESNNRMDDKQKEDLESMEKKRNRPLPQRVDPQLEKCFVAWRNHVSGKTATAQALYERQLLRKGLAALRWAVQLRKVQAGIAQRNHILVVLAASFRKWQDALAKQRKAPPSPQQEAANPIRGAPTTPEAGGVRMSPNLCHLPAEHLEDAARYSRAEGNLWTQLHCQQGGGETCRKAAALRDVRRLAAAFRLWRLQKERLEKEEIRAQEALALLEKKRLVSAFEAWRSRYRAARRILPLVAQVQKGLLSRCFQAWKSVADREALCRHSREGLRLESLRVHFHQWALMLQVREKARKTLLELWDLKRKRAHAGNMDAAEKVPAAHARWSQKSGADALDDFYHALTLQQAFRTWELRWRESQRATAFRRVSERRQLREALGLWRLKTLCPHPLGLGPGDLAEDLLLASPDSEESSLSSGFHSNVPAPPLSSGSLDKERSSEDSSQASSSSSFAIEDSGHLPHHGSPSPSHFSSESQDLAAADLLMQAPFPLGYGHTQNRRQLLAKCFAFWSARTVQNLKAEQHRKRALLSRAFTSWSAAAACFSTWRTTLACLERARRQRLLASSFGKWKAEFLRAERRRKDERPRRRLAGYGATWRWRKAIRGSWALRFSSISQASGYWTRAATFRQCVRRQSGFIGSRKFLKAPLLWPSRRRRTSDEAPRPGLAIRSRLTCSSFRVWLTLYRCQSKTLGPQRAPMHLEAVGQGSRHGWSQETRPEMTLFAVGRRWLGRKYLTRWKHRVLLRRFQHRKEKRCLAGAWVVWKDSCQTELAVQALVRQRLAQWSWAVWRRRCLQSWVAERFLAGEERQLLEQAFGRWRQLTASRSEGRGDF